MDDELRLTLLGRVETTRDGVPVTGFAYKKSLALLCYLAVTGRPHTREALAGLLWGETTEANARAGLRRTLADLRRLVAPHLAITRRQVGFDRTRPYWLDVQVFERQVGQALEARERHDALTDEDAAALAVSVELYRGDFMAGFHVRHALAFEDWVLLERERLRLLALRTLHTLAAHYTARGAYGEGIAYTDRLLTMAPEQEEAQRQMMSLLALSGQQGAALRQYKTSRRVLAEEWGIEPEEETTTLYERIRDGDESVSRAQAPRHNLPASVIPLVGRETELAEIVVRLQDPACRLLTLIGPGGSGKTHLALETANLLARAGRFANVFRDSVYWVSLASLDSTRAIVPAIAQSLGFFFHAESDPDRQLLDYVRQKNLLLVMDNFEHLISPPSAPPKSGKRGGADLVNDILKAASGLKILVTSRTRLNLQSEHLFSVVGMDYPAPTPSPENERSKSEDVAQYSAVQLFLSGVRRVQPNLELTTDDLADVARICRLAEGMPLAILLAAGWTRLLAPAEIAVQLSGETADSTGDVGRGLDLLETDWRDIPARQRSMRDVFDHSWSLLTEQEREVLAALSVFRGGFTHKAAQQVGAVSLRELMVLMDQSLLQRVSLGRYGMHELLCQYAGERVETDEIHDRHSAYFAARLQEWAAQLKSERQQAALAEMEVEITNVRAAWDWAVARGEVARVDQALEGLCLFYEWRKRYPEGESACRAVVRRFTSSTPLAQEGRKVQVDRVQAKALAWESCFLPEHAGQRLQESLALLDDSALAEQDTRAERAFALHRFAIVVAQTDHERAERLGEQSIALYQALEDRWGMAKALNTLGEVLWDRAAYDEAKQLHEKSLAIHRALGDQRGVASSLGRLGTLALLQGQQEGEGLVRESIAIYQEIGDHVSMAHGFYVASLALIMLGAYGEAHSLLDENLTLAKDVGSRSNMADVLQSDVKVHLGRYEQGRAQAEDGLSVAREIGDSLNIGFALIVLGWEALVRASQDREAYAEAQTLFRESADACRSVGQQDMLSSALAFLGYADRGLGQFARAKRHLLQALQIAIDVQSFVGLVFTLAGFALLLAGLDQKERAVELYALASRYPVVSNSRWFTDVVGRPIDAAAAALPPDVVAAAEEQGRARDLDATVAELLTELG